MQTTYVDFMEMPGPFVLVYRGEGSQCSIVATAKEVVAKLAEDTAGTDDSSIDNLIGHICDGDNWHWDDSDEPFEFSMDIGEICSVHIFVKVQSK